MTFCEMNCTLFSFDWPGRNSLLADWKMVKQHGSTTWSEHPQGCICCKVPEWQEAWERLCWVRSERIFHTPSLVYLPVSQSQCSTGVGHQGLFGYIDAYLNWEDWLCIIQTWSLWFWRKSHLFWEIVTALLLYSKITGAQFVITVLRGWVIKQWKSAFIEDANAFVWIVSAGKMALLQTWS